MQTVQEWFGCGERVRVSLNSAEYNIFCRVAGYGPWLTFLHGFPTCSWDWAKLVDRVQQRFRLLFFDFLGFGDSDKPEKHRYSIFEQADLTSRLWQHFGVEKTGVVAHDYGDTVALELLTRQKEGRMSTEIEKIVLLNGGVYVDFQRPLLIQRLLLKPLLGPLISHALNERVFKKRFASIFSRAHPISDSELGQHWLAVHRHGGVRNTHRIIQYLAERRQNRARWETTLESTEVPIRFLWGLEDPVSGRNISEQLRQRLSAADLLELEDVGHYPQLEVPQRIADEITAAFHCLFEH
ncbi:MAG: alpha/beta fold hydrolase [bacterium]